MKKRFMGIIAAIVAIFCGLFVLSACDKNVDNNVDNETETGGGAEEVKQGLEYKTLTVDGINVYGKVSNATETFSFLEEITANGASKFVVALDIYGAQQVATKTIPLSVGDNTAYIMETIDGETVKMYTVTVRRRPMYTVSFYNGWFEPEQQVEEDSFAIEPAAPSKAGYTFDKWNYDFSKPITQNTSVGAVWKAHTDTPYKVQYYWENANDNGYILHETVDLQGETDTTATAQIKFYEHFSHKSTATDSGNINGNGSLILKVYYTRDKYNVTFEGNGGTLQNGEINQILKYENAAVAPVFTRTGYTFIGWDKMIPESVCENVTITAQWKINQYTLTFVFGNGQENKTITQNYGSAIEVETPEREGYDFGGWYFNGRHQELPETMPAENRTITASWNTIFALSENGDTITGLTSYGTNKTKLVIPETIDGVKIVDIDSAAFANYKGGAYNEKDNLKYIGSKNNPYLFLVKASKNLETYEIDRDCKYIGDFAFLNALEYDYDNVYECNSRLMSITIPNSVISIGDWAFGLCNLTSITIGNSVTTIGGSAFYGCTRMNKVYYRGAAEEWNEISIHSDNSNLTSAPRYYYSETEPVNAGKYWHYNENNEIVEW